jgi:hypothetical protein
MPGSTPDSIDKSIKWFLASGCVTDDVAKGHYKVLFNPQGFAALEKVWPGISPF